MNGICNLHGYAKWRTTESVFIRSKTWQKHELFGGRASFPLWDMVIMNTVYGSGLSKVLGQTRDSNSLTAGIPFFHWYPRTWKGETFDIFQMVLSFFFLLPLSSKLTQKSQNGAKCHAFLPNVSYKKFQPLKKNPDNCLHLTVYSQKYW